MTQPTSGTLIADRYVVRSLIGRGGSGAVWRAVDLELNRPVAVKQIVLSTSRSTHSRARAMREAQAVAKLRTPGVVQVYDVHDDGAQVSLIMELIEAPSLARVVRRGGTLTPQQAAQVGRSVLGTLLAVHAAGVVHRDIKPSNVLVGDCGVHITDFGIALLGDDPTLTAAGSALGTPAYMSPEQARGERAGPAADLYGLGATLYFAIEGRPPFSESSSVATVRAVRDRPHRPGARLGALGPIVDGLLAKDPAARPDAAAVAAALDAAEDGIVITPPPATATVGAADVPAAVGVDPDSTPTDARPEPPAPAPPAGPTLPSPVDEDVRQLHRTLLWGAGLIALLALALLLLFLAVRGHPEAPAAAAAVVATRPTRMWMVGRARGAAMEQVNAMRAVLVAGALAAALICAAFGIWSAAVVLLVGVAAHGMLWRHLRRVPPSSDSNT